MLKLSLIRDIKVLAPQCQLVNFYGATETPQAVAHHLVVEGDEDPVPIGRGIADTQVLVLSDEFRLAASGEEGQIAIRSHFRSEGYLGDDSMTSKKFIQSPFTWQADDLLYLTGDYGHFREDHTVVVRGRLDDQVKIRGFRVERREISLALESLPGVEACAVLAQVQPNGENGLAAYLVFKGYERPSIEAVTNKLAARLPPYMVPGRFVWMDSLPLLPNGKLDRAALAASGIQFEYACAADAADSQDGSEQKLSAPGDEQLLVDFKAIFGMSSIPLSSSFQDLGGDSLSYIQGSMAVEKSLGHLPDNWEKAKLCDLLKLGRVVNPKKYSLNSSVVVRAISILLVVFSHYSHFGLLGMLSATTPLFVMAGLSFSKYQLEPMLKVGRVAHVLKLVAGIAVPTVLYALANQTYKRDIHWDTVLLVGNFRGEKYASTYGYWFINVLVQILLALMLFFLIPGVRKLATKARFGFVSGVVLAWGLLINGGYYFEVINRDRLGMLFDGILLVVLGMAVELCTTRARKFAVMLMVLGLHWVGMMPWYPILAVSFVLFVSRVSLPVWLARAISYVAAASLFIYLTHQGSKAMILDKISLTRNLYVGTGCSVLIGIAVWKGWTLVWSRFLKGLKAFMNSPATSSDIPEFG